jgi:hypothetical protein
MDYKKKYNLALSNRSKNQGDKSEEIKSRVFRQAKQEVKLVEAKNNRLARTILKQITDVHKIN